jgi:hypothetical protein
MRAASALGLALLFSFACTGAVPPPGSQTGTGKAAPAKSASVAPATSHDSGSGVRALNDPPEAVFKVRPAPDAEGRITGPVPLTVTYNQCRSTDADPGDELKYTYDVYGNGQVERGRCRLSHTYWFKECYNAVVCVGDRQPDHDNCKTYEVCPGGVAAGEVSPPAPGGFSFTTSLTLVDVNSDGCADYVSIPASQAAGLGMTPIPAGCKDAGKSPQVFVPLADSNGDSKPDSIMMDLDGNGVPDPDFAPSARVAGNCSATTSKGGMLGPLNPAFADTDGDGVPSKGDQTIEISPVGTVTGPSGTTPPIDRVRIYNPWDCSGKSPSSEFGLGDRDAMTGEVHSATRTTGNGSSQMTMAVGYDKGGAMSFTFMENGPNGPRSGTSSLVDDDGDGIYDSLEGAEVLP